MAKKTKKLDRTDAFLARMAAREHRSHEARKKRLLRALNTNVKRFAANDCKIIEDALYPILGRLQMLGE